MLNFSKSTSGYILLIFLIFGGKRNCPVTIAQFSSKNFFLEKIEEEDGAGYHFLSLFYFPQFLKMRMYSFRVGSNSVCQFKDQYLLEEFGSSRFE